MIWKKILSGVIDFVNPAIKVLLFQVTPVNHFFNMLREQLNTLYALQLQKVIYWDGKRFQFPNYQFGSYDYNIWMYKKQANFKYVLITQGNRAQHVLIYSLHGGSPGDCAASNCRQHKWSCHCSSIASAGQWVHVVCNVQTFLRTDWILLALCF